jgi:hypothetical protein
MLVKFRHTCVHCHTRSWAADASPWQHADHLPGCELCARDANRSPELCGDCAHFARCDYCRATGVPVVRIFYERAGTRVADTVCASCAGKHYLLSADAEN